MSAGPQIAFYRAAEMASRMRGSRLVMPMMRTARLSAGQGVAPSHRIGDVHNHCDEILVLEEICETGGDGPWYWRGFGDGAYTGYEPEDEPW